MPYLLRMTSISQFRDIDKISYGVYYCAAVYVAINRALRIKLIAEE